MQANFQSSNPADPFYINKDEIADHNINLDRKLNEKQEHPNNYAYNELK